MPGPPWTMRSTGFASFWLSMNIPCSMPLISTQIFSEMLLANGRPLLSRRSLGLPRLHSTSAPRSPNIEPTRVETTMYVTRPSLRTRLCIKAPRQRPLEHRNPRVGRPTWPSRHRTPPLTVLSAWQDRFSLVEPPLVSGPLSEANGTPYGAFRPSRDRYHCWQCSAVEPKSL